MHQKIWIFDARHIYLGSANMDWKSIAQVKEMGVVVEDCPGRSPPTPPSISRPGGLLPPLRRRASQVFDPAARIDRRVPPWSVLVPAAQRAQSPLGRSRSPRPPTTAKRRSPRRSAASGAACSSPAARTRSAAPAGPGTRKGWSTPSTTPRKSICVSVMDFGPVGLYGRARRRPAGRRPWRHPERHAGWWPSLFDALLSAVLTRKVYVRLLVSKWAHTSGLIAPFLERAAEGGRRRAGGSTT